MWDIGLMKSMVDNNETMLGTYDEFATFIDGLDKGKGLFIFYPGYPVGCIFTWVQTSYPFFRLGYETFCKLAYGGTEQLISSILLHLFIF